MSEGDCSFILKASGRIQFFADDIDRFKSYSLYGCGRCFFLNNIHIKNINLYIYLHIFFYFL